MLLSSACSPVPSGPAPTLAVTADVDKHDGPQRTFSFVTLDGQPVTSSGYRGRMTVVGFAATFDIGSQAQARFINEVMAKHVPRINALLLVIEPASNRPLVEAFAGSLGLRYDVVHAGEATTAGDGPFPGMRNVPSVVLLDRDGREVWKSLGLITAERLDAVIVEHDDRAR